MPNITKMSRGDPDKPLTDKQRRFVEEYVVDMNATAAAVRAGYSYRKSGLYTLTMGLPHVKAAVERALAEKRAAAKIDADRVLDELARMAFSNMGDFITVDADGTPRLSLKVLIEDPGAAVALERLTVEFYREPDGRESRQVSRIVIRMADKVAALRDLGRHLGMGEGWAAAG